MNKPSQAANVTVNVRPDLAQHIDTAMRRSQETNRPFSLVVLQISNLAAFRRKRSQSAATELIRELYTAVRKAVHPSQFVGVAGEGLAIVFDGMDVGSVDTISRKLVALSQHVIKQGRYNDLTERWTDIIYQFLFPNNPIPLFPKAGWAIFPRDGTTGAALVRRAMHHAGEMD